MSMAGKQILTDEMTIVNIFRNMPVAVHARHILQLPDSSAQCLDGDLAFNDAFCQMTGYTPREIEALFENCLDRMVVEEDRAQLMQEIQALCAYPHEGTVSFRVTVKDGRRMRVEERMRSIRQADGSVWLYGVVMDAREDKQQMPVPQEQKRVTVQTFGYLNILIDGEPVVFEHETAKELLAVLIDRQGKFVSSGRSSAACGRMKRSTRTRRAAAARPLITCAGFWRHTAFMTCLRARPRATAGFARR